jgi:predicted RNase H-like HicB family nuclease
MAKRKKPVRYHLPVLIEQDEDGVLIVSVPTLRGCRSYGLTLDEAMKNIAEAAALCLTCARGIHV